MHTKWKWKWNGKWKMFNEANCKIEKKLTWQ